MLQKSFLLIYCLYSLSNFKEYWATAEPCATAKIIEYSAIRMAVYRIRPGEIPICDRNIIKDDNTWYKAFDDMVTNATMPHACGTENGIWMNGTIPTQREGIVTRKACVPGLFSPCDSHYDIKVKNCGQYRVYRLAKPTSCPEAYCFGYGKEGTPPTKTTEKPHVEYVLEEKISYRKYEVLKFKCSFPFLSDVKLYYQVFWYINGESKNISKTVRKEDMDKTYLTEELGLAKLGVMIACAVRLKMDPKGPPGPMSQQSDDFYAGVKLSSRSLTVERGKTANLSLTLTVPFPCPFPTFNSEDPEDCPLRIEMAVPKRNSKSCLSQLASKSECGVTIRRNKWNETYTFTIIHKDNNKYTIERQQKVYLKTVEFKFSNLWKFYLLPDINVHINDPVGIWKGKKCSSYSDPHLTTFDGATYDNQNEGTYTLYRYVDVEKNIMEVQTKVTPCNGGNGIFCNCAIGVRAAGDVFVINRCPDVQRFVFEYRSCIDNLIDVRKIDEKTYKIFFPHGTSIHVRLQMFKGVNSQDINVLEIEIFPSMNDMNQSSGLCSQLGTNHKSNLIGRDGKIYTIPPKSPWNVKMNSFSRTWRVQMTDNLIEMSDNSVTHLGSLKQSITVCTCESEQPSQIGIINKAICSNDKSVKCNLFKDKIVQKHSCFARQRRSLRPAFSFRPDNFVPVMRRKKRSSDVQKVVSKSMTLTEARTFCENFMNESAAFKACITIPNVFPADAISNCIVDIQLTNSTTWALSAREGMKSVCFKELQDNNTLSNDTTDESGESIVDSILSVACPNECNPPNGLCDNGTCKCKDGFGSGDCSWNLNDPPIVHGVNLDDGGLCDKIQCSEALIAGDLFLDRPSLTCKMQRFEIPYDGHITFYETTKIAGDHNSLSDITCPFPASIRRRRSAGSVPFITGYNIAVSNNGKRFSRSHLMYILDSTCQDTMNFTGELRFLLKDGFCFINGQCVVDGTQDGGNFCNVCNYKSNRFAWSFQTSNSECKEKDLKLWIIGVVLGSLSAIASVTVMLVWIKKKMQRISPRLGFSNEK